MSKRILVSRRGRRLGLGLAVAAAAVVVLAACSAPPEAPPDNSLEVNRASVDRLLYDHSVAFRPGNAQPSSGEVEALLAFLGRVQARPEDDVFLVAEGGGRGELAQRRRAALANVLARRGFQPRRPPVGVRPDEGEGAGEEAGDEMLVQVVRYQVRLPDCPDWSRPTIGDFTNMPSSNFGCATATNFGLMVAEPRDLYRGRDPGYADGERAARSIERYRAGKEGEDENSGSQSTIFEFKGLEGGG